MMGNRCVGRQEAILVLGQSGGNGGWGAQTRHSGVLIRKSVHFKLNILIRKAQIKSNIFHISQPGREPGSFGSKDPY